MYPNLFMIPLVATALALGPSAIAAENHAHPPEHAQLHHDFYSTLERPDAPPHASGFQKSCCSDRDCKPVQARFNAGQWEFLSDRGWRSVPSRKMLDVKSPDTRAHACVSPVSNELLCFVKPDFGI